MLNMQVYDFLRTLMLPLEEIDRSLPSKGKIIDLGCGEGIIAKYIAQNKNRKVIGVDLNQKRLENGKFKNLKFELADIRNYNLKNANAVILSDVLHHINFADQNRILKNIANSLKKNATLIVKEIDTGEFIRSRLSRFWDFVFYPREKIYFQDAKELKKKLEGLGFKVSLYRPTRLFPGSTTLFVCKK